MKIISKLLLIFFTLGLLFVFWPQKVLAVLSDEEIASIQSCQLKANQGDAEAQFILALQYYLGEEVPQDPKQAVYWYTKASEQGHVNVQYSLGYMYEYDDEPPQDYEQAFFWYTKAAEQGFYIAKEARDTMLEKMFQSQSEKVSKLSKELSEKKYNKAK